MKLLIDVPEVEEGSKYCGNCSKCYDDQCFCFGYAECSVYASDGCTYDHLRLPECLEAERKAMEIAQ